MTKARQILFIQGAGAGTHDDWDNKLVESLLRVLGDGYEVRYPRMPDEDDPSQATWSTAIRRELAALEDGAVVVGHSVGAAILINALAEQSPGCALAAIVLIAAPFVGDGRLAQRRVRVAEGPRNEASTRRAGSRVPRSPGRDRPAVARGPVCRGDPAGAGAPHARPRSPTEQRSERRGKGDRYQSLVRAP